MLQKVKTYVEGAESGPIEAWDIKYYTNALKSQQIGADPASNRTLDKLEIKAASMSLYI